MSNEILMLVILVSTAIVMTAFAACIIFMVGAFIYDEIKTRIEDRKHE